MHRDVHQTIIMLVCICVYNGSGIFTWKRILATKYGYLNSHLYLILNCFCLSRFVSFFCYELHLIDWFCVISFVLWRFCEKIFEDFFCTSLMDFALPIPFSLFSIVCSLNESPSKYLVLVHYYLLQTKFTAPTLFKYLLFLRPSHLGFAKASWKMDVTTICTNGFSALISDKKV